MSFYTFMMRKYKRTNTPEGDLAADILGLRVLDEQL